MSDAILYALIGAVIIFVVPFIVLTVLYIQGKRDQRDLEEYMAANPGAKIVEGNFGPDKKYGYAPPEGKEL